MKNYTNPLLPSKCFTKCLKSEGQAILLGERFAWGTEGVEDTMKNNAHPSFVALYILLERNIVEV